MFSEISLDDDDVSNPNLNFVSITFRYILYLGFLRASTENISYI